LTRPAWKDAYSRSALFAVQSLRRDQAARATATIAYNRPVNLPTGQSSRWMLIIGVLLSFAEAACGTSHQLERTSLLQSKPRTIVLLLRSSDKIAGLWAPGQFVAPKLFYMPGLLAVLGNATAISDAEDEAARAFYRENALRDPSANLSERIVESLVADYGLSLVKSDARARYVDWARDSDPEGAVATPPPPPADLVLEVTTTELSLETGPRWRRLEPLDDITVGLDYEVETRLIDARNQRILAQGTCVERDPRLAAARRARSMDRADELLASVPTRHDMLEPKAERLVADLYRAGDRCERELRSNVLGLGPPAAAPPPANGQSVTSRPAESNLVSPPRQ
jgi:hypothetical protein